MIRVVHEVHHPEGKPDIFVPKFICNECNQVIEHISNGIILYWPTSLENGAAVDAKVVHKGQCAQATYPSPADRGHFMTLDMMVNYMQDDDGGRREFYGV